QIIGIAGRRNGDCQKDQCSAHIGRKICHQGLVDTCLPEDFTPYVGAALIFLAITIPATRYADYLLARQLRQRS
ncbi:MAG: hypothetical protein AAF762_14545, partial [Pseudomonadota bacterium]